MMDVVQVVISNTVQHHLQTRRLSISTETMKIRQCHLYTALHRIRGFGSFWLCAVYMVASKSVSYDT